MKKNATPIPFSPFAAPARRALGNAGYETLEQVAAAGETQIASLHGIGRNALDTLRKLFEQQGMSYNK